MSDRVRWIRSYVVHEPDGRIGTFCIYEARDGDSIREHARRVGMPDDEFYKVATTVVVRSDAAKDQAGGLIKTGPPADPVRRWVSNRA